MNKITIERAVLEQALEWVEAQPEPRMLGAAKIITSLREALTQQSSRHVKESLSTVLEQPHPVQEPVATVQCIHGVTIGYLEVMQPVGTKLYTSPQAQPLTVAGGAVFQDAEGKRPVTAIGQPVGRWEPTPLFPPGGAGVFLERPQAQPLSDEQITKLPVWRHFVGLMPEHHVEITRAIEQAHGITKGTT